MFGKTDRNFCSSFMEGFASIAKSMTSISIMPPAKSLDDIQNELTKKYGIAFDDAQAMRSDMKAVGDDMKRVLNGISKQKGRGL